MLIGSGRWGASDPWLGIPVRWDQISGVRTIVESDLHDIQVSPSQVRARTLVDESRRTIIDGRR